MSSTDTPAADATAADEYQGAAPSCRIEVLFAGVALAVAAGYLALALQTPLRRAAAAGQIDARFWPTVLGTCAVAVAVLLLVIALTRPAPTREDVERIQPGGVRRVILTLAIVGAFIAAWSLSAVVLFGYRVEVFPIAAGLLMAALMLAYGHRRPVSLIIYSVTVTAFVYVVFGMLLRIPL